MKQRIYTSEFEICSCKIFGFKIFSYGYHSLILLLSEIFLENTYYFDSKESNPIIVDCGANIGVSVLYFKYLFPDSRIIAFEPSPTAFKLLEKNIIENNINGVEIYNLALANKEGKMDFFSSSSANVGASLFSERGKGIPIEIEVNLLSVYLEKLESISLIKIDVEGAEEMVITDLVENDQFQKIKQFRIEFHHNLEEKRKLNLSNFLQFFESKDIKYNIKSDNKKGGEFQDILISAYRIL